MGLLSSADEKATSAWSDDGAEELSWEHTDLCTADCGGRRREKSNRRDAWIESTRSDAGSTDSWAWAIVGEEDEDPLRVQHIPGFRFYTNSALTTPLRGKYSLCARTKCQVRVAQAVIGNQDMLSYHAVRPGLRCHATKGEM